MRNRIAVFAAVVALVATAICWLASGRDRTPHPGDQAGGHGDAAASPPGAAATTSALVPEHADADVAARADVSEPDSPFDLRGTFVVVDADGAEHAAESGQVDVEVDGALTGFEVKAGVWRDPDFTTRERLRVVKARLGGRPVVCDIDVSLEPSNPPLHLRGRWLAPVRLRVIGSDTGADLANVQVVQLEFRQALYEWGHPGGSYEPDPSAMAGTPVLLWPEPSSISDYVVGSPGYTWARVRVGPGVTDQREVRLDPSGAIELAITGQYPYGTTVRLSRDEGGQPLAEWRPDKDGVMRLDGIPGGAWHVAVAKGLYFRQPFVLGHALVHVTPGKVVPVGLTLRTDYVEPGRAIMAGTLVYPNAWRERPRIDIEPTGTTRAWAQTRWEAAERLGDGAAEYRWSAGLMTVGSYQVCVTGSGFTTRFELPPAGSSDLRIVVPEPCDFRVRVLDADTGQVIKTENPETAVWYPESAEWEGSAGPEVLTGQPDGSYVGQAPPCTIRVYLRFDGYTPSWTLHEVVRGTNDFVVSSRRTR